MTVLPTHVDENFPVTKFAQEEESIQEGEISHQLSVGSQLSEKQPFTDSPLSSRLDTFEGFWVNMDGKGEYIPNREEPNQGETNREESSIRTNTLRILDPNFRGHTYKPNEEHTTFDVAEFPWYGK